MRYFRIPLALLIVQGSCFCAPPPSQAPRDSVNLKVCADIIQLFQKSPDAVWPGFNLAVSPFIVYVPDQWALLLNYPRQVDEFAAYPTDWPPLGCSAQIHFGQYKDLVGQLAFDFEIDTIKTVAVGFPEGTFDSVSNPEALFLGGYVHEAFHQYQSTAFGEIPWDREERYPILDRENTALAYVEMRVLIDALTAMMAGDKDECADLVRQFVAVRHYRWQHGTPFVARYEQGQEIREGTARYVEMKSLELAAQMTRNSSHDGLRSISMPKDILADFQERMAGGTVAPEDMLRNRIYPVGCAEGYLLDYFGIEWKSLAQLAGSDWTAAGLLANRLIVAERDEDSLRARALTAFNCDAVLDSTDKVVQTYLEGFRSELARFDAQPGYRVEIEFSAKSLSRSRSSNAKKWLAESGAQSLCRDFQVYTLKNSKLHMQINDSGVFENNDWDTGHCRVVFYAPDISGISLDSTSFPATVSEPRSFGRIAVTGATFTFNVEQPGTITINPQAIHIKVTP